MEMIKETAKVVRQQQIDEGIFDMELSFPKGAALAKPGQFIAMYCNDKSKLLPRPISICGINPTEGTLRVVYRVAGEGTKEFSEMKAGDTLEVMGPLGNGFTMKNEKAIIIGGGIGIPPMLELAKQLDAEKTVVLGYRTSTFLKEEFEEVCDVKIATEDGSQGAKGTVIDAIEKAYSTIDIEEVTDATGEFVFDSSIDYIVEENSIDLVIFSPPYLNNFDFAEMTRMYLYFWEDASSWGDISEKHRNKMLVNTTTALKLVKSKEKQLEMKSSLPQNTLDKVEPIVDKLEAIRKENSKKKEYYLIIYPYLAQMRETLQHCFDSLRTNGEIHIVVSDAAFYGIHIDTQDYLVDILEDIGFRDVKYIRMRDRGDRWILEKRKSSGKQLGEFEIIGKKV